MPAKQLLELFFQPPMAIARLGGSDTPLESFRWREDPSVHGSGKTVIEPSITLEVERDGSVRPYLPSVIHFKDGEHLRPVAPFFELWAYVLRDDQKVHREPLTLKLLGELGVSLESLSFEVTAANLKAARRTGDPSCGFSARMQVPGNNHQRHALLATSPHHPGGEPLVFPDRPIPLGHVQVLRPVNASEMKVDLGIIRLRFTP
ncbi:MAG TPA: hypothetical protein VEZ71_29340, partial [Archangium sp.]|nr:hypothetical protein [Archangium sp.]